MSASEAKALPGGRLAIALLWFGGAATFVPAYMLVLLGGTSSSLSEVPFNPLVFLAWGLGAIALAFAMRRSQLRQLRILAIVWLMPAIAASAAVMLERFGAFG